MRFKVKKVPFKAPCFKTASFAYREQLGVNLQVLGKSGEIKYIYMVIKKSKIVEKKEFI
jgi:hypothetical protein